MSPSGAHVDSKKKLKIAILSRSRSAYSTRRLREAGEARGHRMKVLDTLAFSILVEPGEPDLYFRLKQLSSYDAMIPRIGASITHYGTAVVRQFEQMGVFTLNSSTAISVARDKLRSIQVMSRHAIGLPTTVFVRDRRAILPAIEQLGGAPVVIKLLEGTQGIGVILAESSKVAEAIVETLQSANQNVLIQKFVAESKGRDIRAFVVGGRVVAAMRRKAQGAEFRSNVHRGGTTEAVTLDPAYEATAIKAAQVMGLRVAGVDMLEGKDGPSVMEVNSSPGLEGIETVTGVDIAGAIIQAVEDELYFPDLDLRQRLTLKNGYGVAELTISDTSSLAGKTLKESGLRDREVQVLHITRADAIIPSPRGEQLLQAGDRMLCYGSQHSLRSLVEPRATKTTRKKKPRGFGAGSPGGSEQGPSGTRAESAPAAPSRPASGNFAGGDESDGSPVE